MKNFSPVRCVAVLLLLLLLLSGAIAVAAKNEVQSDPRASFSSYRSYVWGEGTRARREMAEVQLKAMVERELAAKGLVKVDSDADADLRVLTHVLIDTQSLERLSNDEYWKFIKDVTAFSPYEFGAGTLVIDLVDVGSDLVVWRGVSSSEVSGASKKVMRKVDKSVTKLFEEYPGK